MDNKIHVLQSDKPLQNFVVSGVLFQIPSRDFSADFEDSGRSDHNLIEANDIIDVPLKGEPKRRFPPVVYSRELKDKQMPLRIIE